MITDEIARQRQYYAKTADHYNAMHVDKADEHFFALNWLAATLKYLNIRSVLDIGSGTGRALLFIKEHFPEIKITGVEPVEELRQIGYSNGLTKDELFDGDATKLHFREGEFDLVCEFGVLHHLKQPDIAVSEMLRVSSKAIFISDANNFGQGPLLIRTAKQILDFLGLWRVIDFLKTGGKGYYYSEGDGIAYSYSVFNNYKQIRSACKSIHILNTLGNGISSYRSASHVALLGIKSKEETTFSKHKIFPGK